MVEFKLLICEGLLLFRGILYRVCLWAFVREVIYVVNHDTASGDRQPGLECLLCHFLGFWPWAQI